MAYTIDIINQAAGTSYVYDILSLNAYIIQQGGTGGHTYRIDALNELCTIAGANAGWNYEIDALNAISTAIGGTGDYTYEYEAWTEIASIGFGLSSYASDMAFWSDTFDYTTNQWLDKSGNNRHLSLVNSYCLNFNGTNAKVSFTFPTVATADGIKIWAKPSGGSWAIYTAGTAPTGLYRKTGNLLEIGYNGSVYWAGDVAMVQLLSGSTVIWEKPFAQGRGDLIKSTSANGTRQDANLYNMVDTTPADGWIDNMLFSASSGITYTKQILNDGANGWVGQYARVEITGVTSGQTFAIVKNNPGGNQTPVASWLKLKFRTNRTVVTKFATWNTGGTEYSHTVSDQNIHDIDTVFTTVNDLGRFYLSFVGNTQVGHYVEFQVVEYGQYFTDAGTITNATWAATNSYIHKNLQYGYDLWRDASSNLLFATRLSDGTSILTTGGTLASYTWVGKYDPATDKEHNGAETALNFPDVAALKAIDTNNVMYDGGGTAQNLTYDSTLFSGNYLLSNSYNIRILRKKSDIIVLSTTTDYKKINDLLYADGLKYQALLSSGTYYLRFDVGSMDYVFCVALNSGLFNNDFDYKDLKTLEWYQALSEAAAATTIVNIGDEKNTYVINGANLGGNHSFEIYTLTGTFSLDASDVGSIWANGSSYQFALAGFSAGKPVMIPVKSVSGGIPSLRAYTGGTLTHVSGAVHTTSLTVSSYTAAQAYPISTIEENYVKADGTAVTSLVNAKAIEVKEVIKFPYVYDESTEVDGTLTWKHTENYFRVETLINASRYGLNHYLKFSSIKAVERLDYYRCMQFVSLTNGITSKKLFIPNVENFSTYTFRAGQLYSALASSVDINQTNLESGKTPNRFIIIGYSSSTPKYSRVNGYHPEYGLTSDANRLANLDAGEIAININGTTGKTYPRIKNKTVKDGLSAGSSVETKHYMFAINPVRSDNMTSVYYYKEGTDTYLFIDCHMTVTNQVVSIPYELSYKTVTVMDKNSDMTVNSATTGCGTISVSVANNYGYAVIKLS